MLDYVAPFGIDHLIRSFALLLPKSLVAFGFGMIFAAYLVVLARVLAHLFFRVEFVITTQLRRSGRPIPDPMFWLGDGFKKLPAAAIVFGLVVLAASALCSFSALTPAGDRQEETPGLYMACNLIGWVWGSGQ